MGKNLVYSNVSLKKNKSYALYIGGLKYLGICKFLRKPLKNNYKKPAEIIYILPNFPPVSFKGSYVVINNRLKKLNDKNAYVALPINLFYKKVSQSLYVKKIINKILKNQKNLFVQLYKDAPNLGYIAKSKKIKFLGPQIKLFKKYDNKLYQHKFIDKIGIPTPKWKLAHGKKNLINLYKRYWNRKKAFIMQMHSAGGKGCAEVSSVKQIKENPHIKSKKSLYIISDFIKYKDSPTTSAIVANENEVFFNGIMDQIMKGPKNMGSIYPSKLGKNMKNKIEEYTIKIGRELGKRGFRGFFSLDFVVDKKNKIYFSEINPRIGGTTLEKVYFHEATKSKGCPSLAELEFRAVNNNTFGNIKQMKIIPARLSWARFTVKASRGSVIKKSCRPKYSEINTFKKKKTSIFCFPKKGVNYKTGGLLANIVSVNFSRKKVKKELLKNKRFVLSHIEKPFK
ncbi:ATP-grasp domain-containing protein [Candidatus Woesearchaeota archaeon]|nr:ATP-grasp domain-containing protein [Candidatus Woesearchaeota archaeon]